MAGFVSNTIQVHVAAFDKFSGAYKFLVLQRADTKFPYPGIWQVVTGKVDNQEKAIDAAFREVFEETGIETKKIWTIPFVSFFFDPLADNVCASPVFALILDEIVPITISKEHRAFEWLDFDSVLERLPLPSHRDGTKILMEYILKSENKAMFSYKKNY